MADIELAFDNDLQASVVLRSSGAMTPVPLATPTSFDESDFDDDVVTEVDDVSEQ